MQNYIKMGYDLERTDHENDDNNDGIQTRTRDDMHNNHQIGPEKQFAHMRKDHQRRAHEERTHFLVRSQWTECELNVQRSLLIIMLISLVFRGAVRCISMGNLLFHEAIISLCRSFVFVHSKSGRETKSFSDNVLELRQNIHSLKSRERTYIWQTMQL